MSEAARIGEVSKHVEQTSSGGFPVNVYNLDA